MEWSKEACFSLIEEYEKQPVLWDTSHSLYYSKAKKQDAWESISQNLNIETAELKHQMNSLLGSFRREKAKGKIKVADNNEAYLYISKWYAFQKMQFLLNRGITCVDIKSENLNMEEHEVEVELMSSDETSDAADNNLSNTSSPSDLPASIRNRTVNDTRSSNHDINAIYGQYIVKKLQSYHPRMCAFVKRALHNILFNADLGKYDNLPNPFDNDHHTANTGIQCNNLPEASSETISHNDASDRCMSPSSSNHDINAVYGQYIVKTLQSYHPRTCAFVKQALHNILFNADLGKYDNLPNSFDNDHHTANTGIQRNNLIEASFETISDNGASDRCMSPSSGIKIEFVEM